MRDEERIVREVLALWATLAGTIESYRKHHLPDFVWWNSARGSVQGVEACIAGVTAMHAMLGVGSVRIPIRSLLAAEGLVIVERSDDLYRADGSVVAQIPVVGVVGFQGDKIASWRDYCDDWMRDYRPEGAARALV